MWGSFPPPHIFHSYVAVQPSLLDTLWPLAVWNSSLCIWVIYCPVISTHISVQWLNDQKQIVFNFSLPNEWHAFPLSPAHLLENDNVGHENMPSSIYRLQPNKWQFLQLNCHFFHAQRSRPLRIFRVRFATGLKMMSSCHGNNDMGKYLSAWLSSFLINNQRFIYLRSDLWLAEGKAGYPPALQQHIDLRATLHLLQWPPDHVRQNS